MVYMVMACIVMAYVVMPCIVIWLSYSYRVASQVHELQHVILPQRLGERLAAGVAERIAREVERVQLARGRRDPAAQDFGGELAEHVAAERERVELRRAAQALEQLAHHLWRLGEPAAFPLEGELRVTQVEHLQSERLAVVEVAQRRARELIGAAREDVVARQAKLLERGEARRRRQQAADRLGARQPRSSARRAPR